MVTNVKQLECDRQTEENKNTLQKYTGTTQTHKHLTVSRGVQIEKSSYSLKGLTSQLLRFKSMKESFHRLPDEYEDQSRLSEIATLKHKVFNTLNPHTLGYIQAF